MNDKNLYLARGKRSLCHPKNVGVYVLAKTMNAAHEIAACHLEEFDYELDSIDIVAWHDDDSMKPMILVEGK